MSAAGFDSSANATDAADSAEGADAAGTLGHELRMLLDMVVERSAPWLERVRAGDHPDAAEHGSERQCVGWCPICTAVTIAKGQGPEFSARACEQAAQAVALLRAVLADRWHPEQGVHMPGFTPSAGPHADSGAGGNGSTASSPPAAEPPRRKAERRSSPRVQRVAVRRSEDGERLR